MAVLFSMFSAIWRFTTSIFGENANILRSLHETCKNGRSCKWVGAISYNLRFVKYFRLPARAWIITLGVFCKMPICPIVFQVCARNPPLSVICLSATRFWATLMQKEVLQLRFADVSQMCSNCQGWISHTHGSKVPSWCLLRGHTMQRWRRKNEMFLQFWPWTGIYTFNQGNSVF